jgi:hypothetical protein
VSGELPEEESLYFPVYEELASDLLEGLDRTGLVVEDIGHEIEPSTGDRTFRCAAHVGSSEAASRYQASLHFHWDALLTYLGTYGPGSECDLYHEPGETCSHRAQRPHPGVDLVVEYDLGDGGYQLSDLGEVQAWISTVEALLSRVLPDDDGRVVHLNLAFREGAVWVERFSAEQSWYLDLSEPRDLSPICEMVAATLRATPALADRLPL